MARTARTDEAAAACNEQITELEAGGLPRNEAILTTIMTVLLAMNLSLQDIRDQNEAILTRNLLK